jgi:hypothetical protein
VVERRKGYEISPEFSLVAECCRRTFAEAEPAYNVPGIVDWARFVRTARFHRVQGLVWKAIASLDLQIPDEALRTLSADAAAIAADNLQTAFGRAGLPLLFVKGLTLAMLAYGTIATKSGVDIDILVDRQHLAPATELLREQGYRLVHPATMDKLPTWHDLRKESTWIRPDRSLQIDLHTRLPDNPMIIPTVGVASRKQTVEVASGIRLPTLARDELFAYLAVHGASSAWFRLKWITDFSALIHGCPPEEFERLYRRSQKLGAGRASGQALLLADALYGTLAEARTLTQALQRDGQTRRLLRTALRQLAGAAEPIEPTARRFGTMGIHYSQFLLLPGPAFKLSEFVRQARAALA